MLVSTKEILNLARQHRYAIGAFNVCNLEQVLAVVEAAEQEKAPVIIQTSEGALEYAGAEVLGEMVKCAARKSFIPIALHLDHGRTPEVIAWCIENGWTSVMIDASSYVLSENIKKTKEVVWLAKKKGVSVEAELGRISGMEDKLKVDAEDAFFTDPQEAQEFVKETGVDSLAVAIGTVHGNYCGELNLDFERLKKIGEAVKLPLVLHGGSGLLTSQIIQAIKLGINKINIDTDLRYAFLQGCREMICREAEEYNLRKVGNCAREKVCTTARDKIKIFSQGEAIVCG